MIDFKHRGKFSKLTAYLKKSKKMINLDVLEKFGHDGVKALSSATPSGSGLTASSWGYEIKTKNKKVSISFHNSNIQNGVPIAIILQYGHGTKNGGWVQGRDYINPAIQPIFDKMANQAWEEVTKL